MGGWQRQRGCLWEKPRQSGPSSQGGDFAPTSRGSTRELSRDPRLWRVEEGRSEQGARRVARTDSSNVVLPWNISKKRLSPDRSCNPETRRSEILPAVPHIFVKSFPHHHRMHSALPSQIQGSRARVGKRAAEQNTIAPRESRTRQAL